MIERRWPWNTLADEVVHLGVATASCPLIVEEAAGRARDRLVRLGAQVLRLLECRDHERAAAGHDLEGAGGVELPFDSSPVTISAWSAAGTRH
jgi:hypothetical protein